jgi:hypothetical protein
MAFLWFWFFMTGKCTLISGSLFIHISSSSCSVQNIFLSGTSSYREDPVETEGSKRIKKSSSPPAHQNRLCLGQYSKSYHPATSWAFLGNKRKPYSWWRNNHTYSQTSLLLLLLLLSEQQSSWHCVQSNDRLKGSLLLDYWIIAHGVTSEPKVPSMQE